MKIQAVGEYIMLRRIKPSEKSEGGLFMPTKDEKKWPRAEVISVGGCKEFDDGSIRDLRFKAGQTVVIVEWHGSDVELNGETFLFVKEEHILGLEVEEEPS